MSSRNVVLLCVIAPAASVGDLSIVTAKKGERKLGITIVKEGAGSVVQLMVPRDG